mgnify:CR=1 FL=1
MKRREEKRREEKKRKGKWVGSSCWAMKGREKEKKCRQQKLRRRERKKERQQNEYTYHYLVFPSPTSSFFPSFSFPFFLFFCSLIFLKAERESWAISESVCCVEKQLEGHSQEQRRGKEEERKGKKQREIVCG